MKNRLFKTLCTWMLILFISVFLITAYFFEVNILANKSALIAILVLFLIIIPVGANLLAHSIIDKSLSSVNYFLRYFTNVLMEDGYFESPIEAESEKEILDYLKEYGYSYKDIKQSLEKVKNSSHLRKEFSANVSHELKSPLTSINGYAEMIAMGMTDLEKSKEFASIIYKQGHHLLELIDNTIQLSKFDNNYVDTKAFLAFDISKTTEEVLRELANFADSKKVKINFSPKQLVYYGNEKLIMDLIRNLVSNAIKYSKPGGGIVNIYFEDSLDDLKLIFEDNGIGISPEDKARIFERFYVADKSRNHSGTGLGLSLVKNIAILHGGSVEVESEVGEGSKFTVTLSRKDMAKAL